MKLSSLQQIFTKLVAKIIVFADCHGYGLTFGETYRPAETAMLYSKKGIGSSRSLHCVRLAVDFNLFKEGKYLSDTLDHEELGEYWESLSTPDYRCCWGGRFKDGNHYSIEYGGIK